jgi:hypothetical protein
LPSYDYSLPSTFIQILFGAPLGKRADHQNVWRKVEDWCLTLIFFLKYFWVYHLISEGILGLKLLTSPEKYQPFTAGICSQLVLTRGDTGSQQIPPRVGLFDI